MKKSEIEIGGVYIAKVSDQLVRVRIKSAHPVRGWIAINLSTNREIHVKTAARLRRPA